jgi:hypothetical protein
MKLGVCCKCEKYKIVHSREMCKACYQRLRDSGQLVKLPKSEYKRKSIPRTGAGNVATP